jgi:parallel beta-helix repeat protein
MLLPLAILSTFNFQLLPVFAQGSLTPPGAPAPVMKSLDQLDAKLEKRTPISSLPFTINAADNVSDGINAYRNCLIIDNLSTGNGNGGPFGAGIHVTSFGNRIEGNVVSTCDTGIFINENGTANLVFRNSATSNTKQFDILANNKVGVIVTPPNSGVINGSTGSAGLGTTDPWANFSH